MKRIALKAILFYTFGRVRVALIFLLLVPSALTAQKRNNVWCFGDSTGIDFSNVSFPLPIESRMDGRGSCVSISDSAGALLFYAYTRASTPGNTTVVRTRADSVMDNGDNIIGGGWFQELVITDVPGVSNQYYLFCAGVTNAPGLFYSVIDMSLNNGNGGIVQKNIQLLPYFMHDGLAAIKHGNGRDWWLLSRRADNFNCDTYKFLVTPAGISGPFIQSIGDTSYGNNYSYTFSHSGKSMAVMDYGGIFSIFNFDRCSGIISMNPLYAFQTSGDSTYHDFRKCAFSNDESKLYVSAANSTSYLFQLNLLDSNPLLTRDTLWVQDSIYYAGGDLRLGPDGKIYFSCAWYDNLNWNYPYPDSAYYPENMNLGVINYPDSPGVNCDFQPYSFYLGGKRTYWGLPNNPDYDMLASGGSICDTLGLPNGVSDHQPLNSGQLNIFYHAGWQIAFINAGGISGKNYKLRITSLDGKELMNQSGALSSGEYTSDFHCDGLAGGVYVVSFETERERLLKKFVKE